MTIWLTSGSFRRTLYDLSPEDLHKVRADALRILRHLSGEKPDPRIANHAEVRSWRGYEAGLATYYNNAVTVYRERCARSRKDRHILLDITKYQKEGAPLLPPWLWHAGLHFYHRHRLTVKNAKYYGPVFAERPLLTQETVKHGCDVKDTREKVVLARRNTQWPMWAYVSRNSAGEVASLWVPGQGGAEQVTMKEWQPVCDSAIAIFTELALTRG